MPVSAINSASNPSRLGLLLTEGFALMSYAAVIEPFRAANRLAEATLYDWTHFSMDGGPVTASGGMSIMTQPAPGRGHACARIFVFAASEPAAYRDPACFAWLREQARGGASLIGVSGGPYLLARAGLLNGYRATVHWEHAESMREEFPDLALEGGLYVMDRDRMTCAGGTAGMDLAVAMIAADHGPELAQKVADWFIRTDARPASLAQRAGVQTRFGIANGKLVRMISAMESAIEEPLPRDDLARFAGVSLRQLERLCSAQFGKTISELYLGIRLDHAAQLLRSTGLSVTDVGLASGFRSLSHFSRCFKVRFGRSPGRSRQTA